VARGPVLPRTHPRRELELGATTADRHHQGGLHRPEDGADPGRLDGDPDVSARADGAMGDADRPAPWQVHRGRRAGSKDGRDPVRAVARRNDVSRFDGSLRGRGPRALLTPPTTLSLQGYGCPTAVIANNQLRRARLSGVDLGETNATPPTEPATAPSSANSRVRQPDTIITPRQRVTPRATSAPSIPAPPDSGALPSTRPPLHSLVVRATAELDLGGVVLRSARPVVDVVELEERGRRAAAPLAVDKCTPYAVARPDRPLDDLRRISHPAVRHEVLQLPQLAVRHLVDRHADLVPARRERCDHRRP